MVPFSNPRKHQKIVPFRRFKEQTLKRNGFEKLLYFTMISHYNYEDIFCRKIIFFILFGKMKYFGSSRFQSINF